MPDDTVPELSDETAYLPRATETPDAQFERNSTTGGGDQRTGRGDCDGGTDGDPDSISVPGSINLESLKDAAGCIGRPRCTRRRPNKLSNYVMSCLIVDRMAEAQVKFGPPQPRVYECSVCHKIFNNRSNCYRHMRQKHPGVDDTQSVAAPTVVAVVRDESAFKPKLHSLVAALTPDFMESNFTRPVGELVDQVRCGAPSFSSREAEILVAAAASAISGTATLFQEIATLDKANDPTDFCSFRCMITTRPMALTHCFKLEVFYINIYKTALEHMKQIRQTRSIAWPLRQQRYL